MDPEGTAFTDRAVHADATTVHLGDVLDDGEPQSGTPQLTAPVFIHSVKPFEQTGKMFLFDAPSLIGHGHRYLTVTGGCFDRQEPANSGHSAKKSLTESIL